MVAPESVEDLDRWANFQNANCIPAGGDRNDSRRKCLNGFQTSPERQRRAQQPVAGVPG